MKTATNRIEPLVRLRLEVDRFAVLVATAIFTVITVAVFAEGVDVPGGHALLVLFPLTLVAADVLNPDNLLQRELRIAAAWSGILLIAFWTVPWFLAFPLFAVGLPAALCAAALFAWRPAGAMVVLFLLTGVLGSFQAFLGFSPSLLVDLLIGALWLVFAARIVIGRPYEFAIWPALLACALYVAITVADLVTAEELNVAWLGFHTTIVYMLAVPAIAYAGWKREVYRRIAFGFVLVSALVCAYAVLRWVIGPAGAESELAMISGGGINVDPVDKSLRTVGSFQTAHTLALWAGLMAPLCAAYALWGKGSRRLIAAAATALCVLAAFASEARGPLGGLVVGLVVVLALYQVSRAFPGFKLAAVGAGVAALLCIGGAGLALSATSPERLERYTNILDPGDDPTYAQRVRKWDAVWGDVEKHPFGQGLGSGGQAQTQAGRFVSASDTDLDNSYLKVAFEQGLAVAALFVVAMLMLFASLVRAAVLTRSREAAVIGIGAAGTMASLLVSLWTGLYIETTAVLAGWMVIGLGLSYFVAREASVPEDASSSPTPAH
jgi:hypothetical protein